VTQATVIGGNARQSVAQITSDAQSRTFELIMGCTGISFRVKGKLFILKVITATSAALTGKKQFLEKPL